MADQTATQTTAASEPQKLTWDAPDGKHYEGTAEELFKISSERYNNLYPEYSKIKTEAQSLREQQEQIVQQATTGKEDNEFNQQKYWTLMQQNPVEAQNYMDSFRPQYQQAIRDLQVTRQNQEANMFKAEHPDFEANEANVEKLARTCQELFAGAEVYTSRQMSAAYALAFAAKPEAGKPNLPPPPPSGGASLPPGSPDVGQMTQDQLKAYILQLEQRA